jgi:type I restriction enzyme S subunit
MEKLKLLEEVCEVITCGVAKRPNYVSSGIPFLSSKNVKKDRFILDHYNFISEIDYQQLTKHNKPEKGDVLYTRVGSFGEAAVVDFDFKFAVFVSLTLIKPKQNILNARYLMHYLNSPEIVKLAENSTSGIGVQNLNVNVVRKFSIDLPPLATQQKIATILDQATAIIANNRAIVEKYDALTQSLFLEMFGDPVKNEKGWETDILNNVTSKIGSGSTPRGGKESYKTEGISLIRSMNVYDNEFYYKDLAFIDDIQANKLKNVIVEENDVLFNITGASVCRCTIVPKDVLPARVNQHVSILRPLSDKLLPIFLNRLLISENVKRQLLKVGAAGGATMEAITKEKIENFEIIIPPITIQNQFAERVQLIEAQKQQAQESLAKSEELFNSLLQKAFKGELN